MKDARLELVILRAFSLIFDSNTPFRRTVCEHGWTKNYPVQVARFDSGLHGSLVFVRSPQEIKKKCVLR